MCGSITYSFVCEDEPNNNNNTIFRGETLLTFKAWLLLRAYFTHQKGDCSYFS